MVAWAESSSATAKKGNKIYKLWASTVSGDVLIEDIMLPGEGKRPDTCQFDWRILLLDVNNTTADQACSNIG